MSKNQNEASYVAPVTPWFIDDLNFYFNKLATKEIIPPADNALERIAEAIQKTYKGRAANAQFITHEEIQTSLHQGIQELKEKAAEQQENIAVISLTDMAGAKEGFIDARIYASRTEKQTWKSKILQLIGHEKALPYQFKKAGLQPKDPEKGTLKEQLDNIANDLKEKGITEIALVDDFAFTGETLKKIITEFKTRRITVKYIVPGMATNNASNKLMESQVTIVSSNQEHQTVKNITAMLLMHEFIPGAPNGGMNVEEDSRYSVAPFLLPLIDAKRAGVTYSEEEFSLVMLMESITLWMHIEEQNNKRPILNGDLPTQTFGIKPETRILDGLTQMLTTLIKQLKYHHNENFENTHAIRMRSLATEMTKFGLETEDLNHAIQEYDKKTEELKNLQNRYILEV